MTLETAVKQNFKGESRMKKKILVVIMMFLLMNSAVSAQERVKVNVLLDGEELVVDGIMAMYKNGDSYENPKSVTKEGLALVFAQVTKENDVWYLSKEVELKNGDNVLDFNEGEINHHKIVMGKNIHAIDDNVIVVFDKLPDETKLELKIQSENAINLHISDNLKILHMVYTDVKGSTGILVSQATPLDDGSFRFDGNYYLKSKMEYVLMPSRPSFDELFDICLSEDLPIGDMFIMGAGGGCDYRYFNKDGKLVLDRRFGHPSNELHFEDLSEGIYDMEFNFNDGDLILTAKNITFLNEERLLDKSIDDSNQVFEVYPKEIFLSDSEIDFHELMKKKEKKIVFVIDENEQLDGNVMNQGDIDLFHQYGKEFSIKTNFVEVEFDKELIAEMSKVNRDLSMHIKNGLSFYSKEESEAFMKETYNIADDMTYVCDYEIKIFLSEYDLIAGDFPKRATLVFYPYDMYLEDVDFSKISIYSDIDKDKSLDLLGGNNKENSIRIKLELPSPYYYFNLYERPISVSDLQDS